MKIIIALLITLSAAAQTPSQFFLEAGFDPSMAIKGAYPDREDKAKGLDFKLGLGWEFPNTRIITGVQSFKKIGFTKFVVGFDYKIELDFNLPIVKWNIRNVFLFGGMETSWIKRHHPDASYDQPNNYREYVTNWFLFGLNGEIQYRLGGRFGIAIQGNIHQAEDDLKPYKKYRKQVHLSLIYYFNRAKNIQRFKK